MIACLLSHSFYKGIRFDQVQRALLRSRPKDGLHVELISQALFAGSPDHGALLSSFIAAVLLSRNVTSLYQTKRE